MKNLDDIYIFTMVVLCGSIGEAARTCNLQRSKISRRMQELEKRLGVQLLIRTTRNIELTSQGQRFFDKVNHEILAVANVAKVMQQERTRVAGDLRIAVPTIAASTPLFTEAIKKYNRLYPDVRLDIQIQSDALDLEKHGVDIQMLTHFEKPKNNHYIQQSFINIPCYLVASPEYIKMNGSPNGVEELCQHSVLGSRYNEATFIESVSYSLFCNDLLFLRNMVLDGRGIAVLPAPIISSNLYENELVRVLPEENIMDLKISLIYPAYDYMTKRCQLLVDILRNHLNTKSLISYPSANRQRSVLID